MLDSRTLTVLLALTLGAACSDPEPELQPPPAAVAATGSIQEAATPVHAPMMQRGAHAPKLEWMAVKNVDKPVHGLFEAIDGAISLSPTDLASVTGRLALQLDSIESGKYRRDNNVRGVLFGLAEGAVGLADVEIVRLAPETSALQPGDSTPAVADLKLTVRGVTSEWQANVLVTRETRRRWAVKTADPVALSMESLGLGAHVTALKAVCEHESLNDLIEITASLVFEADAP
jgi:hypothetical protein